MNEQQANQALAAIVLEIPPARRPLFERLYKEWARLSTASTRWASAMESGGSTTRMVLIRQYRTNPAPLRDAAARKLRAQFPKQAERAMRIGVSTPGLGQGAFELALIGAAIGAGVAFGAAPGAGAVSSAAPGAGAVSSVAPGAGAVSSVAPGAGAVSSAGATVADTYAAMSQAAGLTTSGNIAADISLASAVQTGSLPVAAAQSYAASIASGAIPAAEVTAGLAAEYGIGGTALSVADIARNVPTPKPSATPPATQTITTTAPPAVESVAQTVGDMALDTATGVGGALISAKVNALIGTDKQPEPMLDGGVRPPPQQSSPLPVLLGAVALAGALLFS